MLGFLAVGGYYSSPTKDLGEKGRFASIIDAVLKFITTNWIFFSLLILIIILILSYYLYRRLKRKKEEFSSDSTNSISDAF